MQLRKLKDKDSVYMLEWMHDASVVEYMQADFKSKTLEDCKEFIELSADSSNDLNMAIVDSEDNYMGTVSLKHIDGEKAEFAITVRKEAMGKEFAIFGMREIIKKGFEELGLKEIYWCVNPENKRAVRFYDKNGYSRVKAGSLKIVRYSSDQISKFIWYRTTIEDNY